jgi:REP element-mobilizing transposase RayT
VDRQDFLKTLAEACPKTGFQVPAYCLMCNHFHLVLEQVSVLTFQTFPFALARNRGFCGGR